jgi:hypothetical protein
MQIWERQIIQTINIASTDPVIHHATHLGVELKPTVWCEHHKGWWTKRIFRWQQNTEMVQSSFELGSRRTA